MYVVNLLSEEIFVVKLLSEFVIEGNFRVDLIYSGY